MLLCYNIAMVDSSEWLNKSVNIARIFISQKIKEGDVVVDATAGNGHDTLFLAQAVGKAGKVYSFDIQRQAINRTNELLSDNGVRNVALIQDGHEHLDRYISGNVKVIVFNLGYLPGSDKNISTSEKSTIAAIKKGLLLLDPGGAIFLVVYYGQPTGPREKNAVLEFSKELDQQQYNVSYLEFINQANDPPSLLSIEKRLL